MSSPTGHPPRIDERLTAVASELGLLAGRIDTLGRTLNALVGELQAGSPGVSWAAGGAPSGTGRAAPPGPPADASGPPVPPRVSPPYRMDPVGPLWTLPPGEAGARQGDLQYPYPIGPRAPRPVERLRARLTGAALLAATGGAVTLLGVVLLLVLAAARGWFSPAGRVSAGAVLGVVLVGLAVWLYRRREARTGALALAATGVAALYLTVAAATALYELVPPVAGLAAALVVAVAGLALADRWRAAPLATGVVAGAGLLAPLVTTGVGPLLVGLALILQAAALPVAVRRGWPGVAAVPAGFATLYGLLTAGGAGLAEPWAPVLAVTVAGLVVGLASAVLTTLGGVRPPVPAVIVATAPLPLLAVAVRVSGGTGALLALGAAVGLGAVAAWGRVPAVRWTALVAAAAAVLVAADAGFGDPTLRVVLLAEAVSLLVAAAVLRSRPAFWIGAAFGVVGWGSALTGGLPVAALVRFSGFDSGVRPLVTGLLLAVLVLATGVVALVAAGRTDLARADAGTAGVWVPAALVALYGAAGTVVAAALLVSPDRTGFLAGHAVVTVSWTVAALILLARGIDRPALRVAGAVLVAAAVAKLVLFDLVALDGLARVAAFLGAGLVLLAAGSRYARLVARSRE